MNSTQKTSLIMRTFFLFIVSKLLACLKVSFAIGAAWTLFSLRNMIAPLAGAFGGIGGTSFFFASNLLFTLLFKKTLLLSYLAYSGIPTFFAGLYWATSSRVIRAGVPALCMLFFMFHPEGMAAWPYALFWFMPITIACMQTNSIFVTALGSTFTAHAVGSVLWLYTTSMGASYWYALLPIVPVERLLFAVGMTASHMLFSWLFSHSFNNVFPRWLYGPVQ
jgi:hypothetical protein